MDGSRARRFVVSLTNILGLRARLTLSIIALKANDASLNPQPLLAKDHLHDDAPIEIPMTDVTAIWSDIYEHPLSWYFREYVKLLAATELNSQNVSSTTERLGAILLARGLALMKLQFEHMAGRLSMRATAYLNVAGRTDAKGAADTNGAEPEVNKTVLASLGYTSPVFDYYAVRSHLSLEKIIKACEEVDPKPERDSALTIQSGGKNSESLIKLMALRQPKASHETEQLYVASGLEYNVKLTIGASLLLLDDLTEALWILRSHSLMHFVLMAGAKLRSSGLNEAIHIPLEAERAYPEGSEMALRQATQYVTGWDEYSGQEALQALLGYQIMRQTRNKGKVLWGSMDQARKLNKELEEVTSSLSSIADASQRDVSSHAGSGLGGLTTLVSSDSKIKKIIKNSALQIIEAEKKEAEKKVNKKNKNAGGQAGAGKTDVEKKANEGTKSAEGQPEA